MNHKELIFNGYECYYKENGIYYFHKKVKNGYFSICCTEQQLMNGDIEFMSLNDISLSKKLIKKEQKLTL